MYRHIMSPGWTLGWTWAKKEVIWSILGAQATDQGDCSKFRFGIPHSCKKNPTIVDLLPGVPKNQRFASCCKGGVLASMGQEPAATISAFQLNVGHSGTSNYTVKPPKDFYLLGPGLGYTCSAANIIQPSFSFSPDGRRRTQAMSKFDIYDWTYFVSSKCDRDLKRKIRKLVVNDSIFNNYHMLLVFCSDMDSDMHLFTTCSLQEANLLRFLVVLFQPYDHSLSTLCLWLYGPKQLHQV